MDAQTLWFLTTGERLTPRGTNRHVMVWRDDFFDHGSPMTQDESGLVSEDIWWEMVDRLQRSWFRDVRHGVSSRGRHHAAAH